ncbi:MAG: transcription elongation factor Spt5 [Candidatus Aenigmarchaeota archaeon]|nr:transcription elongation factor Spt5 [Candidatus Aenigmarchaeota archaeon]
MIFTIRTTSGREDIVVDLLISKIQSDNLDIRSVFHPAEIKGYVFVEGPLGSVHKAMVGLMHSRGLIDKPINIGEIQHFLEYKKARIHVDDGDIVEIIGGPFKGEKGRVKRINKIKDEVTAELLEASIPIPVTIATEFVKIIKKAHPEKIDETAEAPAEEDKGSVFDKEELEKLEGEDQEEKRKEREVDDEDDDEEEDEDEEKPKQEPAEKVKDADDEAEKPEEEPATASQGEAKEEKADDQEEDLDLVSELEPLEKKKKRTDLDEDEEDVA